MIKLLTLALALGVTVSVSADVQINFVESAPKDSFVFKNVGECEIALLQLEIDLSNSRGGLIFDTTGAGAGVEVFQPFEVKTGELALVNDSLSGDGDNTLSVVIENLQPNASASFTIDVDDTMPESSLGQIRVTGAEVEGALVHVKGDSTAINEAKFNAESAATVLMPPCA